MQIPVIWRRGQAKPFGSVPRINWSHPLAFGLTSYMYDCGGGVVIDLVRGNLCSANQKTTNGTASISSSPFGGSWLWSGTTSLSSVGFNVQGAIDPLLNSVETNPPSSAATGYLRRGNNTPGWGAIYTLTDTLSNTPVWIASSDINHPIANFGNAGITFGFAATNNVFCTTASVLTSTTSMTGYHIDSGNGFNSSTVATAALGSTNLFPCTYNESNVGGDGALNGQVFYGALWRKRALTAAEIAMLHQNPYSFLIYPEDEMFALLVAAAAPTPGPGPNFLTSLMPMMGVG